MKWLLGGLGLTGVGVLVVVNVVIAHRSPQRAFPVEHAQRLSVEPVPVDPGSAVPAGGPPLPVNQPQPVTLPEPGADPLTDWARGISTRSHTPPRALHAYANVALTMRTERPNCHLSWTTLAGLGRIESDNGQIDGRSLGAEGVPSEPIVGVALDGSIGLQAIPDSDGGALDADAQQDRAVGPMQFIPSTWKIWGADGNGDGKADPQQIDDAALTAGRYLCRQGRDLAVPADWWAAVFSYNQSVVYGQQVFGLAERYADLAPK